MGYQRAWFLLLDPCHCCSMHGWKLPAMSLMTIRPSRKRISVSSRSDAFKINWSLSMSVQVGVFAFSGQPVASRDVAILLVGLEERAPDYVDVQVSGLVGMGFRGLAIAPEDTQDQPLLSD